MNNWRRIGYDAGTFVGFVLFDWLLAFMMPPRPPAEGYALLALILVVALAEAYLVDQAGFALAVLQNRRFGRAYDRDSVRLEDAAALDASRLDEASTWRHPLERALARRLVNAVAARPTTDWVRAPATRLRARMRPCGIGRQLVELELPRACKRGRLYRVALGVEVKGDRIAAVGTFAPPHRRSRGRRHYGHRGRRPAAA